MSVESPCQNFLPKATRSCFNRVESSLWVTRSKYILFNRFWIDQSNTLVHFWLALVFDQISARFCGLFSRSFSAVSRNSAWERRDDDGVEISLVQPSQLSRHRQRRKELMWLLLRKENHPAQTTRGTKVLSRRRSKDSRSVVKPAS